MNIIIKLFLTLFLFLNLSSSVNAEDNTVKKLGDKIEEQSSNGIKIVRYKNSFANSIVIYPDSPNAKLVISLNLKNPLPIDSCNSLVEYIVGSKNEKLSSFIYQKEDKIDRLLYQYEKFGTVYTRYGNSQLIKEITIVFY